MGVVSFDGRAHFLAPAIRAEGVDVFVLGEPDRLIEGLAEVGEGRGGFWFDFPLCDGGEKAAQSGSEIAGGQISVGEEVGYSSPACSAARDSASLRAWKKQRCGWSERRGVRQWRPSAKVKAHKLERSFEGFVDMEVSRKKHLSCKGSLAESEAHYFTGVM